MDTKTAAHHIIDQAQNILQYATVILDKRTPAPRSPQVTEDTILLARCMVLSRARREREKIFATPGLFADPAWDILLELFMIHLRGQQTSVTNIGLTTDIPQTTVLRWLNALVAEGLVERTPDPGDGRRALVSITKMGALKVRAAVSGYTAVTAGEMA